MLRFPIQLPILFVFLGGIGPFGPLVRGANVHPPKISYRSGMDTFEFTYEVLLPRLEGKQAGSIWIPAPKSDAYQKVTELRHEWPSGPGLTPHVSIEPFFKNVVYHFNFSPPDAGKKITFSYRVERREKSAYPAFEKDKSLYLKGEPLVPLDGKFKKIAEEITAGKKTYLAKGRAIYDHVFSYMKYDKSGTGWGRGDAVYACDVKTGNCTDFHALFIAIARSAGIPARFAVGFSIPLDRDEGAIEGYHCWAEFLAEGQWVPVDISEAWKVPETKDYYFGHHPANRLEVSAGRFFEVSPKAAEGPINFLAHPYLEVDGKAGKFAGAYSFKRQQK